MPRLICAVLLLVAASMCGGCISRTITVRGECVDVSGSPRTDIAITQVNLRASFPKATLEEKESIEADASGRFSLSFKTRHSWMLKVAWGSRKIGSYGHFEPPPELRESNELFVTIRIGGEWGASCYWRKEPRKAPEPTPRPVMIPAEPGITPVRVVANL